MVIDLNRGSVEDLDYVITLRLKNLLTKEIYGRYRYYTRCKQEEVSIRKTDLGLRAVVTLFAIECASDIDLTDNDEDIQFINGGMLDNEVRLQILRRVISCINTKTCIRKGTFTRKGIAIIHILKVIAVWLEYEDKDIETLLDKVYYRYRVTRIKQ